MINYFEEHKVKLVSLKENFDTSMPHGCLMMAVFQPFSQFERDSIVERTKGLKSACTRGRKGRPPRISQRDIDPTLTLYESQTYSVKNYEDDRH